MDFLTVNIRDLAVTQDGFRDEGQIDQMVKFVSDGGIFTKEALLAHGKTDYLIKISRFPDGRLFIHDGHHRIAAIYLGGRKWIREDEFVIKDWTYEDYRTVNLDCTPPWITPFDPRFQIRIMDYSDFKFDVQCYLARNSKIAAHLFVMSNSDRYIRQRNVLTIRDLVMRSL
jgi:hypothetical protein